MMDSVVQPPVQKGEVRSLTGIRGVAALYVVIYHYVALRSLPGSSFLDHGYIAVDLFFVLSGFVMAMTYGERFEAGYTPAIHLNFLLLRLGRTYPLYICVTVFCLLVFGLLARTWDPTLSDVLANIFLVQTWGFAPSADGVAWSISTEFAAYIVFPIFVWLLLHRGWAVAWIVGAAAFIGLAMLTRLPSSALNQFDDGNAIRNGLLDIYGAHRVYPLLRCLFEFPLGLLAWRARTLPWLSAVLSRPAVQWGLAVATVIMLAIPGSDLILVILFALLIPSLYLVEAAPARALGGGTCYRLGVVSYSLYLVHYPLKQLSLPLVHALNNHIPAAFSITGLILLAPAVLLAFATFHGVEKPARKWSRKLLKPAKTAAKPTVARPQLSA